MQLNQCHAMSALIFLLVEPTATAAFLSSLRCCRNQISPIALDRQPRSYMIQCLGYV